MAEGRCSRPRSPSWSMGHGAPARPRLRVSACAQRSPPMLLATTGPKANSAPSQEGEHQPAFRSRRLRELGFHGFGEIQCFPTEMASTQHSGCENRESKLVKMPRTALELRTTRDVVRNMLGPLTSPTPHPQHGLDLRKTGHRTKAKCLTGGDSLTDQ